MPLQGFGPAQVVGNVPPVNPLPTGIALAVWVDSVNGVDTNPGTQALPFRTFARVLAYRRTFSITIGTLVVHCMGAGPYTWGSDAGQLLASLTSGALVIQGDTAAETVHVTSTFTGPMVAGVIPATAGLGAGTQRGRHLRITSGTCAGVEFPIGVNTDTSITPVNVRSVLSFAAIANGDTFTIFTPGTAFAALTMYDACGGGPAASTTQNSVLSGLCFHRILFNSLTLISSTVTFASCTATGTVTASRSNLGTFIISGIAVLLGLTQTQMQSVGLTVGGNFTLVQRAFASGNYVLTSSSNFILTGAVFDVVGLRVVGTFLVRGPGSSLVFSGITTPASGVVQVDSTITVDENASVNIPGNVGFVILKWNVTAGNCFTLQRGGMLFWRVGGSLPTGGTTALTGFAIDTRVGGRCFITFGTPTLTGGTAGKDLVTTATPAGVANATLAATPSTVDALGSPYGEVLARAA